MVTVFIIAHTDSWHPVKFLLCSGCEYFSVNIKILTSFTDNEAENGNHSEPAVIKMTFSHVKRNKKERILVMEDEHSLKVSKLPRSIYLRMKFY